MKNKEDQTFALLWTLLVALFFFHLTFFWVSFFLFPFPVSFLLFFDVFQFLVTFTRFANPFSFRSLFFSFDSTSQNISHVFGTERTRRRRKEGGIVKMINDVILCIYKRILYYCLKNILSLRIYISPFRLMQSVCGLICFCCERMSLLLFLL